MKNQRLSFTNFLLVILYLFAKVKHGRPRGGRNGHLPPCKLGLKTKFIENLKLAAKFR